MKKKIEKRMYFLTMYNISPIQQGIQCGHAQMEYALQYWNDPEFQEWAKKWKTWIILNGGTSNTEGYSKYQKEEYWGTMDKHYLQLLANKIKCMPFYEPDLSNSLTAIAFIVDERVFNRKDYPDFMMWVESFVPILTETYNEEQIKQNYSWYDKWLLKIGGKQNEFLRDFLKQFRMA
jgi:hypothetical protein